MLILYQNGTYISASIGISVLIPVHDLPPFEQTKAWSAFSYEKLGRTRDAARSNDPTLPCLLVPQMVVFGDSSSDAGRRFAAPASFDFDGIGPFPWLKLFEEPDSDVRAFFLSLGLLLLPRLACIDVALHERVGAMVLSDTPYAMPKSAYTHDHPRGYSKVLLEIEGTASPLPF